MKRRVLLKYAGAFALLPIPLRSLAQAARVPVVGILAPHVPGVPLTDASVAKLAELGHVDGRTIRLERRMIEGGGREAFAASAAGLGKPRGAVLFAASE